jgi:hypothetical protein
MENKHMSEAVQIRSQIFAFLRRELIGPDPRPEHLQFNAGEEVLRPQDPPRLRYSAGVLFPGGASIQRAEAVDESEIQGAETGPPEGEEPEDVTPGGGSGDPDETTEHEVNRANEFLPSAMGLTALVRLPKHLRVTIRAGCYEKKALPGLGRQDKEGRWQPHNFRKAVAPPPIYIDCSLFIPSKALTKEFPLSLGLENLRLGFHIYSRPYANAENPDRDRLVTFTLINRTEMSGDSPKDHECFFQCGFEVEDTDGAACFLDYPEREGLEEDEEEQSLRLLYRHRHTFAVGHGCAAAWPEDAVESATRISTDSLPSYEIKPILPREIPGLDLSMRLLSEKEDPNAIEICDRLAAEYLSWIEQQEALTRANSFPAAYRPVATRHLTECRECHRRIRDGITLLQADPDTKQAFAWMNRAMLEQQLHYNLATNARRPWVAHAGALALQAPYQRPDWNHPPAGKGRWRPFQLAFILMNLRAIAQRDSSERGTVDLIWFPTGGGKTEAYLGLTAFTIFRRRLSNRFDAGTTALMRYTLRLLTTQQFQRAASLICACEIIRQENEPRLGPSRISIGLWVGGDVTPNKHSNTNPPGAVQAHNRLLNDGKPNPFVVITCPWCGAEMGPVRLGNAYRTPGYKRVGTTVVFRCDDPNCEFHHPAGLPLHVVDEAIYEERPTLLIGTVDKFAMLPWNPEARHLFGLDNAMLVSPPDLIIQDELHLIAGALGSMVGMYETTIDALCRHEPDGRCLPAKIVASTATICRAPQQVHALYARKVLLFPPQGLRVGDSFFAEETLHDHQGQPLPGRLYVGVFGSALSSHVTAQVRVMAALLQSVKCVQASAPDRLDPYWTLMSYFNSLRELGHAATLIRADIREYLNALWDRLEIRKPAPETNAPDLRRFINRDLELTSRIQSSEITNVLQQLFNSYPGTDDQRPVDVCLATNMIQVGLDVPRLGLMTVVGQPKTTSEYIQATSRVGRDVRGPGLVIAVYNPSKPRDRSHFEHFRSYHQSIYRWVEPTSVTPFAVPVRERALHAQLVTLARYWGGKSLRDNPNPPPTSQLLDRISRVLIQRIQQVDPGEKPLAEQMLVDLIERWKRLEPPIYGHFGPPPQETPLMYPSGTEPRAVWANRAKATPTSMRNVDSGCDAGVIQQFPQP